MSKASGMPFAPSRAYLSKVSKKENRPAYFVADRGHLKIDITHPDWTAMLERRGAGKLEQAAHTKVPPGKPKPKPKQAPKKTPPAKKAPAKKQPAKKTTAKKPPKGKPEEPPSTPSETEIDMSELVFRSQVAELEEQILKNEKIRYQNEQEKIKLKKEAGDVIDFALAEFLFFGYMEKLNIELLGLTKKINPIIANLVKEGNTKGVLKRFNREFESILRQVKTTQKDDLVKWKSEQ